jgi:type IV pilus assembly protein PilY1
MRNIERRSGLWKFVAGIAAGLYLSAPVYAFTPSESPLLSAAAVAPNVMLLIDDSGSMNNIIWAAGFKPDDNYPQIANCSSSFSCLTGQNLDMSDTNIFLSSLNRGGCSTAGNWYGFYRGFLGLGSICLRLPDPVGNGNTRYSANYLSYLVSLANGTSRDFTTGAIPNDYRISVAQDVSTNLVASNRSLRIGLATFNPPVSGNPGPGGFIARAISDLSPVSGSVTQAQANANYTALINSINGLSAIANTPLAESYYEVTRYMRGMAPYYNSTPSTYTSPIQYRCQKNYGVVITDGLPTYDRTFPTNDPLGGSRLPNWDGNSANDGDNLNGDGEGDTLYLDDIAKFAFDIDMRTTGTDAGGKSWNAADFPKQNMNTYTVGFTAANQMLSDAASYGQVLSGNGQCRAEHGVGVSAQRHHFQGRLRGQRHHQQLDRRCRLVLLPDQLRPQGLARHGPGLWHHRHRRSEHLLGALDHRHRDCSRRHALDLSVVEHGQQCADHPGLRQFRARAADGIEPGFAYGHHWR